MADSEPINIDALPHNANWLRIMAAAEPTFIDHSDDDPPPDDTAPATGPSFAERHLGEHGNEGLEAQYDALLGKTKAVDAALSAVAGADAGKLRVLLHAATHRPGADHQNVKAHFSEAERHLTMHAHELDDSKAHHHLAQARSCLSRGLGILTTMAAMTNNNAADTSAGPTPPVDVEGPPGGGTPAGGAPPSS